MRKPDKDSKKNNNSNKHQFEKRLGNADGNDCEEALQIENRGGKRTKSIILAIIPLVILAGMIYFLLSPYSQNLINTGVPLPEVTIEKIEFHENQVVAFIRNTGPEQVTISQADIDDRIQSASIEPSSVLSRLAEAKITIPFLWNTAQPYEVGITTSDGTRFSKMVEAAAPAPIPNVNQFTLFTTIGVFVGVIPVLIGLLWYPFMRKISKNLYNFFLSLTAGLLLFLGLDAMFESNEIAIENIASTFNGQMLIIITTIATFLALYYITSYFSKRASDRMFKKYMQITKTAIATQPSSFETVNDKDQLSTTLNQNDHLYNNKHLQQQNHQHHHQQQQQLLVLQAQYNKQQQILKPLMISLMVAIGIGLHNFGEGLAIGAAVLLGEVALSTFLIIGFTLHNTTEGLAIVAPLAKTGKLMVKRLVMYGLIAGIPTIIGTWIGGFVYSPLASVIFLSIGAGAIFQVIYAIISWLRQSPSPIPAATATTTATASTTLTSSISENQNYDPEDKSASHVPVESSSLYKPSAFVFAGFIIGMLIMYITGLLI
ncbi:MAG: ZIP family metal transporter [Candidatus Nitrosocosmicus sp.]|nr:ZIP family metal transporter [Candidatus Nitrosocosmicus sp.]MDN5867689.1 ZIP family metal transporter [Candidatus Nitrosocosmicus sp.]